MEHSIKVGMSFGLTSGAITTMGLMVGLAAGTDSRIAVIGGILTIAIADSFSDALGIHISEESENVHTSREVWASTLSTFFSKLFFALTFLIPTGLFELKTAVIVSVFWGFFILFVLSYYLAVIQGESKIRVIGEHLIIAGVVIVLTNTVGKLVAIYCI